VRYSTVLYNDPPFTRVLYPLSSCRILDFSSGVSRDRGSGGSSPCLGEKGGSEKGGEGRERECFERGREMKVGEGGRRRKTDKREELDQKVHSSLHRVTERSPRVSQLLYSSIWRPLRVT
jgi:hypothetical protein